MSEFLYGLHPAHTLSNSAYHALDAVGKSDLDKIARSPMHWKHAEREETSAMRIGSAVHCAVLEPERFSAEYVVAHSCDKRTKAGKEQFAEFEAANAGRTVLSLEDGELCVNLQHALHDHPRVRAYLSAGQPEVSALWRDEEFNVRCRARYDWLHSECVLLDLKTTQDASASAFAKSCATFRYHVQAAWYLDSYQAATGELPMGFVFIAVEKTPPYAVALYELDAEAVDLGRALARRDLARYANARDFGVWPGYPDAVQSLSLPKWATYAEIEE
ncbi:MAG TPA: exodeoxyribonuclease VIII [Gammaproteobacteria bacterium]|nr:exodeoxyribonuclease VIII [Gammaproteobacteria bacterium]